MVNFHRIANARLTVAHLVPFEPTTAMMIGSIV
jgi:hypothetical protein